MNRFPVATDQFRLFLRIMVMVCLAAGQPDLKSRAQDDLDVLKSYGESWLHFTDASNSLYHFLAQESYEMLEKRSVAVSGIQTLQSWQERQELIRSTLLEIVGPFPERTPLNPRITGTIKKGDYRVEHIIYESQPGFYVTSSLFIPGGPGKKKMPAVIYCSGHSEEGYRSKVYQHIILNLVKKGFVVFAFDIITK